jgi:RNA binding exosome subunit
MKKYLVNSLILILLTLSIGCKKYSASTSNNNSNSIAGVISEGTWTISSYTQRTEDKSAMFTGINFIFSSDGKLSASGTKIANGTWVYSPASTGYYGNTLATFSINLGTTSPFDKLSKAWNIGEQNNTVLRLDNPETTEDEHVTFLKK